MDWQFAPVDSPATLGMRAIGANCQSIWLLRFARADTRVLGWRLIVASASIRPSFSGLRTA
jgi:hypothetical protein